MIVARLCSCVSIYVLSEIRIFRPWSPSFAGPPVCWKETSGVF